MVRTLRCWLCLFLWPGCLLWGPQPGTAADAVKLKRPSFRISVPSTVLTDVPVKFVRIEAVDASGRLETSYRGQPLISGVRVTRRDRKSGVDVEEALGAFDKGVLLLETNLQQGRKVYITDDTIHVAPEQKERRLRAPASLTVRRIWRWWSVLPPLLAVLLSILLRNVVVAILAGLWSGAVVLLHGDVLGGLLRMLDTYLIEEITQPGRSDPSHMLIILFTLFLGALIGVMSRSGGTEAIVRSLRRWTRTREHGQMLTWGMGFAVFFDDYANTLLVGGTMRSVTDRLKISRAKLAFLVDSTAAPVAGLALISTWVGVEVSLISDSYRQLFGESAEWNGYSAFLATLPYRFYALHLLVFVLLIAYTGNDYGPMLRAEARAIKYGDVGAVESALSGKDADNGTQRVLLRNALIPLLVLIVGIGFGLWKTGLEGLAAHNAHRQQLGQVAETASLWTILQHAQSSRVIFHAAFLASATAVLCALIFRSLSLREATEAWIEGAKSMFPALLILVMAWAVATICNPDHLNTAGFVVEVAGSHVSAAWAPALAFVLAAVVSFATGSSYATMGLLMPLFITMTFYLLTNANDAHPYHNLLLATIGAVLAGSIFGDHCSPISDTTVLSSAATGCDHLQHVATQMPYALSVAGVSLLLGYLPVGFNIPPYILLPLGAAALLGVVSLLGHPAEDVAATLPKEPFPEKTAAGRHSAAAQTTNSTDETEGESQSPGTEESEAAAVDKSATGSSEDEVDLDELDVDWNTLPENR